MAVTREDPRLPRAHPRPHAGPAAPRLKPVEEALFVLMSDPMQWYLVDTWSGQSALSALCAALRRRGAEVVMRSATSEQLGYARWTHAVPTARRRVESPVEQ